MVEIKLRDTLVIVIVIVTLLILTIPHKLYSIDKNEKETAEHDISPD